MSSFPFFFSCVQSKRTLHKSHEKNEIPCVDVASTADKSFKYAAKVVPFLKIKISLLRWICFPLNQIYIKSGVSSV